MGTRVPWAPRGLCRSPLGDGVHRWVLGTVVADPSVPPGFLQEQEPDGELHLREHQPAPGGQQEGPR